MSQPITPRAELHEGKIWLTCPFNVRAAADAVPGRRWDPWNRVWVLPNTAATLEILAGFRGLELDDELMARLPQPEIPVEAVDVPDAPPMPLRPGITPFAHQQAAYALALQHDGYALLHEPGCGKTLTAIALIGRRHLEGQVRRCLVVAPLSVIPAWEPEWAAYSSVPATLRLLTGSGAQKAAALKGLARVQGLAVAVINYESVWRLEDEIAAWRPDMIVCDESQRIKNPKAKQSRALHRLGRLAKYRLMLTGTPVNNGPLDFWSQYRYLDPTIFEGSYYAFRNHYAVMGGFEGKQVVAYRDLGELTRKAHSVAHRVTKAEALDLPPYTDQLRYCTLEPAARKLYNTLERESAAELEAAAVVTAPLVVTRMLRLSQLTGGYLRPDEGGEVRQVSTAKLQLLEEVLEDLVAAGKKIVIFARFVPEIHAICSAAAALVGEAGCRAIWGETPGEQRGQAVQDFQTLGEVRVFVAQTRTAGLGITLHAADTCIFYSLDYSYETYEQARARIHRAGQCHPCTAIHLIAQKTIDEDVLETLRRKKDFAAEMVDRWRERRGHGTDSGNPQPPAAAGQD
ncbi:DEAD/DEAH box helicase [Gehongia tenuis]|nr:DEAD/DEAH box helicase [Gehongia tenuis]